MILPFPPIPPAHLRIIYTAVPNLPLYLLCLPTAHYPRYEACHSMAHGIIISSHHCLKSFSQLFSPRPLLYARQATEISNDGSCRWRVEGVGLTRPRGVEGWVGWRAGKHGACSWFLGRGRGRGRGRDFRILNATAFLKCGDNNLLFNCSSV